MVRKWKAPFKSYESIRDLACKMRERLGLSNRASINIVKETRKLVGKEFGKAGVLNLKLYVGDEVKPAFVSFNPLTLNVHKEIWDDAEIGEPYSKFIIAHEIGHIVLHNNYEYAFSNIGEDRLSFIIDEEDPEQHANWFASLFLAPDQFVKSCRGKSDLCQMCDFPEEYAEFRLQNFRRYSPEFVGDTCPACANFTLVRKGTCLKCETCGGKTGCS